MMGGGYASRKGPKSRKSIIKNSLIKLFESDYFNEWRTSAEIADEVTKSLSKHWGGVSSHVIGSIMVRHLDEYKIVRKYKYGVSGAVRYINEDAYVNFIKHSEKN